MGLTFQAMIKQTNLNSSNLETWNLYQLLARKLLYSKTGQWEIQVLNKKLKEKDKC